MQIIFAGEPMPTRVVKSLFLEGPSPRSHSTYDWKVGAVSELEQMGFDGTVFIPIPRQRFNVTEFVDDKATWTYDGQIAWEVQARERADIIVCYADRHIDPSDPHLGMPGLTTNVEFGEDLGSGKLVYGRPDDADKVRYLDKRIEMRGEPIFTSLRATLEAAVVELGDGAERTGGEAAVPLFIWQSDQFQGWYANLVSAGNRLDDARLMAHVKFSGGSVFAFVLWVNVWVHAEQRHKSNEVVVSRKDISSVLAYHLDEKTGAVQFVLVKEFRSTVNNPVGFVYELPGGSSVKPDAHPLLNAQEELCEEVGLYISDIARFRFVMNRQLAATFSTHRADLYAIRLTDAELKLLRDKASANIAHGEAESSERTYVVIAQPKDLKTLPVDFTTWGMIHAGLADEYCDSPWFSKRD